MVISSRTPEGQPNHCLVCGADLRIEPSDPAGDAPCPRCGLLLWFTPGAVQVIKPPPGASLKPEQSMSFLVLLLSHWHAYKSQFDFRRAPFKECV